MAANEKEPQPPPEPVGGVMHVFAATKYSLAGLSHLWGETAFRLELLGAVIAFGLFFMMGAQGTQYLILALFFLWVFGMEALNTAIEMIVDEISPHRSEFARRTKDLGSFACACSQLATGLYALTVIGGKFLG